MSVADKLRSDYEFVHTLDAKLLPRGDTTTKGPFVRLLKPFDDLFVDIKVDFDYFLDCYRAYDLTVFFSFWCF